MTGAAARAVASALALAGVAAGCRDVELVPIRAIGQRDGGPIDCGAQMIGFATLTKPDAGVTGTTGGAAGATVSVDNLDDLTAKAGDSAPLTIRLTGMLTATDQVRVKTDKTIIGVGTKSGLSGSGFNLTGVSNVILRNLVVEKAVGADAITINHSNNVWVDHCDLSSDLEHVKDYYDGLIDITHGADYVTVSWTLLHDHDRVSFIGGSDDDGPDDIGHLTVTFEHNLFLRTNSHNPSIRFGMLHALNNYFLTISDGGISSRENAVVRAEANYFDGVTKGAPLMTHYESPVDGFLSNLDNEFTPNNAAVAITQTADFTPPYAYKPQLAHDVPATVMACVGVGTLNF